jgi:hypothetical protein
MRQVFKPLVRSIQKTKHIQFRHDVTLLSSDIQSMANASMTLCDHSCVLTASLCEDEPIKQELARSRPRSPAMVLPPFDYFVHRSIW